MLYCHGNGGNVSARGDHLAAWQERMGMAVLIFDYPGYGRSGGRPNEAGCYAAADAAHDWLTTAAASPPAGRDPGGSLGAGVAVDLACRRPHRALVLYSPFTSFPDLAQEKCRWLPTRRLVRNRFDNLAKIGRVHGPVFIAAWHGGHALNLFHHGVDLYTAAVGPKRFLTLPGYGHNGGFCEAFYSALAQFLEETGNAESRD